MNEILIPPNITSGLLHIPFEKMKCWDLVCEVERRLGFDIPLFNIDDSDTPKIAMAYALNADLWEALPVPESGCVIAMAIDPGFPDYVQHFGVCLGSKFIHTLKKTNVILTDMDHRFYKNKMKGFHRWKNASS